MTKSVKATDNQQQALIWLRHSVPLLLSRLSLKLDFDPEAFCQVLERRLIPRMSSGFPLVVAITGGGSVGKSTLFNALAGERSSLVAARAGASRRVLVAMHPEFERDEEFLNAFVGFLGTAPEPLRDSAELGTPGKPLYIVSEALPEGLVLLDTPDFDTGDREEYANRGLAKPVLDTCDVLLYVFTNATYNNRENTRFVREVLTEVGFRKAALVYRCSRAYPESEIESHAGVVGANLYGDDADKYLIGVYRANEDDSVAAGEGLMLTAPIGSYRPLSEALDELDRRKVRGEFMLSAIRAVGESAGEALVAAESARAALELYQGALRVATSWAVTEAMESFPQKELLSRFLEAWETTQPRGVKALRRVSRMVSLPVRLVIKGSGKLLAKGKATSEPNRGGDEYGKEFKASLLKAANELRNKVLSERFTVRIATGNAGGRRMKEIAESLMSARDGGAEKAPSLDGVGGGLYDLGVFAPEALRGALEAARGGDWTDARNGILEECEDFSTVSAGLRAELERIAMEYRGKMGALARVREFFTASLGTVATGVAVVYVLSTGDTVVGPGMAAKLVSLFGMNDLWGLVAIPVTAGLNAADRKNLEGLIKPIFKSWFKEKSAKIGSTLDKHLVAGERTRIAEILEDTNKPLEELREALEKLFPEDVNE